MQNGIATDPCAHRAGASGDNAEVQLLVSLLLGRFCPDTLHRREWTSGKEDALLAAARWHGIVSLAYRAMAEDPSAPLPLLETFRAASHEESVHGCILAGELIGICDTLRRRGIHALALKGPALSVLAHGHPACRSFSDLDILVGRHDVTAAVSALAESGYVKAGAFPDADGHDHKDVCLQHPEYGVSVDLHWTLYLPSLHVRTDLPGLWKRAQTIRIGGHPVATLDVNDTLLYLCIHGAVHRWCRLKWVCDITALLSAPVHIRWHEVMLRAVETGCLRMLLVGTTLASRLFHAPLPGILRIACAGDPCTAVLVDRIVSDVVAMGWFAEEHTDVSHPIAYRERVRDRILVLSSKLSNKWHLTDADVNVVRVPKAFRPLYLFIRPVRLFRTYGLRWLKVVFTGSASLGIVVFNTMPAWVF